MPRRTQVAIVGAGPRALRSRTSCTERHRVGRCRVRSRATAKAVCVRVLEHGTWNCWRIGRGERCSAKGWCTRHRVAICPRAIELTSRSHDRIAGLWATGSREGPHRARLAAVGDPHACVRAGGFSGEPPRALHRARGRSRAATFTWLRRLHGVCRAAIPAAELTIHERLIPSHGWHPRPAGPSSPELVYAHHDAASPFSMRSPTLTGFHPGRPRGAARPWPDEHLGSSTPASKAATLASTGAGGEKASPACAASWPSRCARPAVPGG
jgi:hypothetical protein